MSEKQRTLAKEISLTGKGLHTGKSVTITFKPAPVNHGYKFCRVDLPGRPIIDALAENVTETSRGTTLVQNNASVSTIEHVMAAFHGLRVDNALIDLDGPEAPIMGGSAWKFVEAIKEAIMDEEEGADIIMVKPAMAYLDIIREVKDSITLPVSAYHVSGEYAMIKAAAKMGWLNEDKAILECLTSIKRAGADLIATYFAKDAVKLLKA